MPFRLRNLVTVAVLSLALSGCLGRGQSDITGSLGTNQPLSEQQWRSELGTWQPRYDANQNDKTAAFRYARALRGLGQQAQAVAVLQSAVIKHPKDLDLLGAYGRALMDVGQLKQAEDVLARAHMPERPDWRILSAQGAVADQMGDHPRAQGFYETALRINPGEPTIMSNLGLSYALSKRLPEAESVLTAAAKDPRADKRVRQNLVLVLGLQGRFAEAERVAAQDLAPADVAKSMTQLRQMVSQPNSWDMLRNTSGTGARRPDGRGQDRKVSGAKPQAPASALSRQPPRAAAPAEG
jgi:Flp pilus assembly protein TadD